MIFKMPPLIFNSWSVIFIRITMIFNDLYYGEKWSLIRGKMIFNTEKNDLQYGEKRFYQGKNGRSFL